MAKIETTKRIPAIAANVAGTILTLTCSNGRRLELDADSLSSQIRQDAMLHGLKQKLVDAAAILRNPDTGASATVQDKFDAMAEVFARITKPDGTWNKVRGDGTGSNVGLLVRALMALTGDDEETVRGKLETSTDDEVKALKSIPKVAAKMAEFRLASSSVDTDALLAKFSV